MIKSLEEAWPMTDKIPGSIPRVVCLIGSTKFKTEYREAEKFFTRTGKIVLTCGLFGHADGIQLSEAEKADLDRLHLWKIELADFVHVINPGGYIGNSTRREIQFAKDRGKHITYMEVL